MCDIRCTTYTNMHAHIHFKVLKHLHAYMNLRLVGNSPKKTNILSGENFSVHMLN